jgi:dihydropteroate synthase
VTRRDPAMDHQAPTGREVASERELPTERGVVAGRPDGGGGAATPSFEPPAGATPGLPSAPSAARIGPRTFRWGERTFVMGIINVTPDSFSGDGLLGAASAAGAGASVGGRQGARPSVDAAAGDGLVARAVTLARSMAEEGADLVDVGGESSRPGHAAVPAAEEASRVVPVVRAIRAALPDLPISIDTTKPSVAAAAIDAGANLVNDVWGVAQDDRLARVAAERRVPLIVMHNRAEARYVALLPEVLGDLARALERALAAGCRWDDLLIDPGFGFGKAPEHNLELLRELPRLHLLGRPVVLGTSRKSTLGKILDLPAEQRLEATLATTALAAAAGIDVVRVHDVRPNVRVARTVDAVARAALTVPDRGGPAR